MDLAPIVLFTFNRLEHTKRTVEALMKNKLADQCEIYIFSDGPRNELEAKKVKKVRQYINSVTGFKKVTVYESKVNKGLAKSVIEGVTKIINHYGKVIVLEDDLVTSEYFIEYMNEALKCYKKRKDIWSIAGYCPNIKIPASYKDEIYLTRRGASWGWATWKEKWKLNDWKVSDYNEFKNDRKLKKQFNETGSDMSPMLNDQMEGRINSWAIRWVYNEFKNNMFTVYPIKSLVRNIGTDLSGTHSSASNKYDVKIYNNKINLNVDVEMNNEICREFKKFYDLNFWGYIAIFIKKIGLYKPARKFRNKILLQLNHN